MNLSLLRGTIGALLVGISISAAHGAPKKISPAAPAAAAKDAAAKTTPPQAKLGVPPAENLLIMIRTTLVALYHASVTANFSVLRDLGAPGFQAANSVERLAQSFASLRRPSTDMAQVVLVKPTLMKPPVIDDNGMLRLTGSFETKPHPIDFDLLFQAVEGNWRLFGISVQVRPPAGTAGATAAPPAPGTARAGPKATQNP